MIVGIDLGTTNSLAAAFVDGEARIIPNVHGHPMTPSVVGLDADGAVLVGMAARDRLITHPERTAATFKRYMGTDRSVRLGDREFRPEELSSLVLRSLKADAEALLGEPVHEAVITVPAYFNDAQRKATRIAGELAGLRVERLLNEPTAAALAYGLDKRDIESQFLVFDLGGGTFDVSLLELFEGVMEIRASAGDNFLGGEDFVHRMMDGFVHACDCRDLLKDREAQAKLRELCERAKRTLSESGSAEVSLLFGGKTLTHVFEEAELEKLAEPLLERIRAPLERALRDAKVRASELDEIVMVGGATRMPMIRRLIARLFGRIPNNTVNPDQAVALGAAIQAALKARNAALDEVVMTDVCPYTLGVDVCEELVRDQLVAGHFLPIIERNTTIPASRSKKLHTTHNMQKQLLLSIYQGEARLVKDNIHLGEIKMAVPPKPAGVEAVEVRFTYDINGLLEVEATVLSTSHKERLVIEGNPGVLSREEIERCLAELARLKVHPREQDENRAVMARAERLYEEHLGDLRIVIGKNILAFQGIMERQDPHEIDEARAAFTEFLGQIEGDPYL